MEEETTREWWSWWAVVHGGFMVLAFGICLPVSLLFPLYLRRKFKANQQWLDLHLKIHLVGFLFATLGFAAAFHLDSYPQPSPHHIFSTSSSSMNSSSNSTVTSHHLQSPHSWFGLSLALVVGLVLPMLGLPDEHEEDQIRRVSLDRHGILGKLTFLLSIINLGSGLNVLFEGPLSPSFDPSTQTRWLLWGCFLSWLISSVIFLKFRRLVKLKGKVVTKKSS